jgi:hypothetical protein
MMITMQALWPWHLIVVLEVGSGSDASPSWVLLMSGRWLRLKLRIEKQAFAADTKMVEAQC